jgi:CheY-like chemotaxis protein
MPKIELLFLIDDDADDQHVFAEALSEVDDSISLLTASNGLDALETLRRAPSRLPDLIFLDLNMPKMNGKQFLKEIKSTAQLSNIPVVIYSTSSARVDREETLDLGASDFIVKPNSYGEVRNAIRISLKR